MTKAQLVKTALKARKLGLSKQGGGNNANNDSNLSTPATKGVGSTKETAGGNTLKTVPNGGIPNPKKPNNTQPSSTNLSSSKPRAPFDADLVKYPDGKGGKSPVPPTNPAGAIFWPKAKTRKH